MPRAFIEAMILALGILVSVSASVGLISMRLNRAPEGFEDETGFHFKNNGADIDRTRIVSATFGTKGAKVSRPAGMFAQIPRLLHTRAATTL